MFPFDPFAALQDLHALESSAGFPPYNVVKDGENGCAIEMAVAGFAEEDLEITSKDSILVIRGRRSDDRRAEDFYFRGIAGRSFVRRFRLDEHARISGAELANGMLKISLSREVPEHLRARRIDISTGRSAEADAS